MASHLTAAATLLILSMARPSCALPQTPAPVSSAAPGQAPRSRAISPAGTVHIEALPRPASWMNVPKDFRRLAEDSFSITASKETDLYNSADTACQGRSGSGQNAPAEYPSASTAKTRLNRAR
jgi:hypothetical protein